MTAVESLHVLWPTGSFCQPVPGKSQGSSAVGSILMSSTITSASMQRPMVNTDICYCVVLTQSPSSLISGKIGASLIRTSPSSCDFTGSCCCELSVSEPWMGLSWGISNIKPVLCAWSFQGTMGKLCDFCSYPPGTSRSFWDSPCSACTFGIMTERPAPSQTGAPHASVPLLAHLLPQHPRFLFLINTSEGFKTFIMTLKRSLVRHNPPPCHHTPLTTVLFACFLAPFAAE